jgi:hypothetical protein
MRNLNIIWLSEIKLRDFTSIHALRKRLNSIAGSNIIPNFRFYGGKTFSSNRRSSSNTSGGAWIVLDPTLIVDKISEDALGMVSVSARWKGCQPVALIGFYNPPINSALQERYRLKEGLTHSEALLAAGRTEYKRLVESSVYSLVAMCGDFNMRAGPAPKIMARHGFKPRRTEDKLGGAGMRMFHDFMLATDTLIVHGTHNQEAAFIGSRKIASTDGVREEGTGAEVDAWLCSPSHLSNARGGKILIRALPKQLDWSDLPPTMTHLPVNVVIVMERGPGGGRRRPKKTRAPKRLPAVSYNDVKACELLAEKAMVEMVDTITHHRTSSIDEQYQAVVDATFESSSKILKESSLIRCSANDTIVVKDNPLSYLPALQALRKKIEATRKTIKGLVSQQRKASLADEERQRLTDELASKTAEKDALVSEHKAFQKLHRSAVRRAHHQARTDLVNHLTKMRTRDPHSFFEGLNPICPADNSYQSSQPRPDMDVAHEHFSRALREDRASVKAILDGKWDRFIPFARDSASGKYIMSPTKPSEVFLAMGFHPNKKLLSAIQPCSPGCKECGRFITALNTWDPKNPAEEAPAYKPSLGTCVSGGSDGITPDILRFARLREPDERFKLRMRMATGLSLMFNRWLTDGTPSSADFAHSELTALLKKGTPGCPADPRNPKDTRGIAVGNVFPKIFALVILRRLSHWCINQGIISPEQIGFMPNLGAEMHVYSALETLRLARKRGIHASLLFVDITGAYDNVHRKALWYILRKAGLPAEFITMLTSWYDKRTAAVKIGKERSPRFATTRGEPQGDVLSPLLWNIFFEPLLRKLSLMLDGLHLQGPTSRLIVKHQAYADDLTIFCGGRSQRDVTKRTQAALDVVLEWARDWGVQVNTKAGKTEAMYFSPSFKPGDDPSPYCSQGKNAGFQPLNAGLSPDGRTAIHVQWTREYKYLGFPLTMGLGTKAYVDKRVQMLQLAYYRYFAFNRVVYRLPIVAQMQIANTLCLGQINYLLGILPVDNGTVKKLEKIMRDIGRSILRLPVNVPNELIDSEMIGFPMKVMIIAQSLRAVESLRLLEAPFDKIPAARLLAFTNILIDDKNTFASRVRAEVDKLCRPRQRSGEPPIPSGLLTQASNAHGLADVVAIFKRTASAAWIWAGHPRNTIFQRTRTAEGTKHTALQHALRPPPLPAKEHLASLYGVGLLPGSDEVGRYPHATPLSATIGGWSSGALMHASSTRHPSRIILLNRLGRHAFDFAPFKGKEEVKRDESDDEDGAGVHRFKYNLPGTCTFCGSPNDDPMHLYCECPHHSLQLKRTELVSSFRSMLSKLMAAVKNATTNGGPNPETNSRVIALANEVLSTLSLQALSDKDLHFVLFRSLAGMPFSARAVSAEVAQEPMPLATTLGAAFDLLVVRNRWMRPIANILVSWADKWSLTFADLRKQLLAQHASNA